MASDSAPFPEPTVFERIERGGATPPPSVPSDIELMLDRIEAAAKNVYADHGLPIANGHYARNSPADPWRFLGERLDVEARWALVTAEDGAPRRRFARLEDLGSYLEAEPDVVRASEVLRGCRHLRERLRTSGDPDLGEDFGVAIELGEVWRRMETDRQPRVQATNKPAAGAKKPRKRPSRAKPAI